MKGVFFSVSIYYIKHILTKIPNRVSIDRTDNDEDFPYLAFNNVDGYIEEIDKIKYFSF